MGIREEISKDLERVIQSDVSDFTDDTLSGAEGAKDLEHIKSTADVIHKLKMDSLEEERKEIELEKAKLDYADAKKKYDTEEADRLAKNQEKIENEKKQRRSEIIWKIVDVGVKVLSIVVPTVCSMIMFKSSMKMEYIDNGITPKPAKDLWNKMLNRH